MNAVRLLEVSLSAAVVILATAVLRLIFRKLRVSKRAILLLWIVVAVRLMIPIPLYSPLGIIPAFSANDRSTETKWNSSEPFFNGEALPGTASDSMQGETGVKPKPSNALTISSRQEKSTPAISLDQLLLVVYLTGLVGMAAYFIISYWILVRKTKKSEHIEKNLYTVDWIGTAFVLGFVRPKVFVPAAMGKEFRGMVLKHEYAHIAHGDQWYKAFAFLLLAVHWFNPMVWLAYHLFNEDLEYACDERVIKGMSEAERRDYSEALLSVSGGSRLSVSVPVAFSKKSVIGRIKAICGRQKPAAFLGVLAVLISFALGACLIPNNSVPEEARNQWDSYQTETWLDQSYYVVPVKEGGDPLLRVAVDSGFKEEYLEPVRQLFIGSPDLTERGFYISRPEYQDDRIAYYWAYRIHKSGNGGASWTQNEQVLMILEKGTDGNWSAGYVLGSTDADPSEPGNGRFEEAFRPLKEKLEPGFGLTDSEMEEVKAFVTQKMTEPPFVMTENGGPSEEVIREYRETLEVIYDREWSGKAIDAAWERPGEGVSDLIAVVYVKPVREPESEEAKKLSASIFSDAEPAKIYAVHRSEKGGELKISRVIDSNVFPAIE